MSFATKPTFVKQAFANNGIKNTIPDTTLNQGYASYDEGFPAITMQPKESGGLPPRGQDMNGILNELSQFNQYQQMGGTYGLDNNILTNGGYAKNSVVFQDDGIYRSLVDNNTDDFVDDPSVIGSTWQLIVDYNQGSGTNGVPGQFSFFARTDVPTGWLRCDGTQYTKATYSDFWDNYLTNNKLPTCSYADYATEISDNGNCGKFAVDLVNLTFKVPTLSNDIYITQALISGNIAKFNAESLPNITANVSSSNNQKIFADGSGAFRTLGTSNNQSQGTTGGSGNITLDFDASNASSVYQNGAKVKTDRVQFPIFVCVANIQVPVSEAQYNGFISNLNQKVDLDGSNATFPHITESYISSDGLSWYRKYSDGWIEQGGMIGGSYSNNANINFLVPFINTKYVVNFTNYSTNTGSIVNQRNVCINAYTTTGISFEYNPYVKCWEAKGYFQ